jgi:hypothetical protein
MEQMTTGFFDTWKGFMLDPPLPDGSNQFQIDSTGVQYRLTYKDGTADVTTIMGRDYAIRSVRIKTPEFDSTIEPSLSNTAQGFILSGYNATYDSRKPEEATRLKVLLDYQDVGGLQLVRRMDLSCTYGGKFFAVVVGFSNCHVTKN